MSKEGDASSELEQARALLTRTREDLLRLSRKAALSSQLAGTAHDLRNSVGFMTTGIEVLERHVRDMGELLDSYAELESQLDPKAQALLRRIKEAIKLKLVREDSGRILEALAEGARRTEANLNEFLGQVRGEDGAAAQPCDLADLFRKALKPIRAMHWDKAEIVQDFQPVPKVPCNPNHVLRLFENLVLNAIHSMQPGRGKGHVWIALRPGASGDSVAVEVKDDGVGIPEEHQAKVFEPFFTTKPAGMGVGLGLTISREIVEEHHGTVKLESCPGQGTRVEVVLPLSQPGTKA